MIKRDNPRAPIPITPAFTDEQNPVVANDGKRQVTAMKMNVDNNFITDVMPHTEHAIAASVDSIFQVLGNPEPQLRKIPCQKINL